MSLLVQINFVSLHQEIKRLDNMVYIVVVFNGGVGHVYQENGKTSWVFSSLPKYYTKVENAKKRANKLRNGFVANRVVVYQLDNFDEAFSTSDFKNWEDRIVYETK